jgi:hypothetical protein
MVISASTEKGAYALHLYLANQKIFKLAGWGDSHFQKGNISTWEALSGQEDLRRV